MKINIIGWYDRKNCGDESFKTVFNQIFNEHEIYYTSQGVKEDCDYYILGGGDVVKSFYLDHIPNDKNLTCIGVGLEYESESELLKNKNINSIYVRNKQDVEIFSNHEITAKYTPDIVFNIERSPIIKNKIHSDKKKMAVILTDHVNPSVSNRDIKEINYSEYFKWELSESLDYLTKYYQIYFIALSDYYYANDNKMNIDIQSRMSHGYKSILLKETDDPYNLIDIIQQMDIVVSMKFHGLIFSTICHVPFINIGPSRKTNRFCTEMNLSEISFNPRTFNNVDFLSKIKYVEDNTAEIKNKLQEIDTLNKSILKNNIKEWREIIK